MKTLCRSFGVLFVVCVAVVAARAESAARSIDPLVRTVDLNLGQEKTVELSDGSAVRVKLVAVDEHRDSIRHALREAVVTVELDGKPFKLTACNYRLPQTVGRIQIDCPVTKGYVQKGRNPWSLDADARLRLWPAGSPWIRPGSFCYPMDQRWLASMSQMCNEVADGERVEQKTVYYHWGLDFGGTESLDLVLAAVDGTVVSVGGKMFGRGPYPEMVQPRADVVYLRDARGWYYRYSHLDSVDPAVELGSRVTMGQKIGILGKKGTSGGWSHLHFDVARPQPSGRYGIDDAYAFAYQAYQAEHPTPLVAVARPHKLAAVGETVSFDASASESTSGDKRLRYEWTFDDGTTAEGVRAEHRYDRPGDYRATLKLSDSAGNVAYDFAKVVVLDRENPRRRPPNVHATYWPTFGVKPGDAVTFQAITRDIDVGDGHETWDFGDGSPTVTTQSLSKPPTYGVTNHAFPKPGVYLVSVERKNRRGETGTDRLAVRVESADNTATADHPLRVATFTCDVTPPIGHMLTTEPLKRVEHPLAAKGIVLDDGKNRYILCAMDWCILSNGSHLKIRQAMARAAGTTTEHVCLQTVHQHTAPMIDADGTAILLKDKNPPKILGTDPKFVDQVARRMAKAVGESLDRFQVFDHVGTGQAKVDRIASARRILKDNGKVREPRWAFTKDIDLRSEPEGHIDPYLKTVTLAHGDKPVVRLHYYAVHPQTWYRDGRASYDFVGLAREQLEKKEGVFQLYFTGCAGDITVGKYNDATPATREQFTRRLLNAMEGAIASTQLEPLRIIGWRCVPLMFPLRTDKGFTRADLETLVANPKQSHDLRIRAASWLAYLDRHDRPIDVAAVELGRARLLHLPGEPFVDYQLYAQRLLPDNFVAVAGYGDDGPWYLYREEAYDQGGYEPSASMVPPESETTLRGAIHRALLGK